MKKLDPEKLVKFIDKVLPDGSLDRFTTNFLAYKIAQHQEELNKETECQEKN